MESMSSFNQLGTRVAKASRQPRGGSTVSSYSAGQSPSTKPNLMPCYGIVDPHVRSLSLEKQIIQHPKLTTHFKVVCTYLKIDLYVLEPISFLRQEGVWGADMAGMHGSSVRLQLPEQGHRQALAEIHPRLFDSPPSDLFDIICKYRHLTDGRDTGIIQRLEKQVAASTSATTNKVDGSGTAPEGYRYKCPSAKCTKTYSKGGHIVRHIDTTHPEYLQLHPEWQPSQHIVKADRSLPSSPEIDRRSVRPTLEVVHEASRHTSSTGRPLSSDCGSTAVDFLDSVEYLNGSPSSWGLKSTSDIENNEPTSFVPSSIEATEENRTSLPQLRRIHYLSSGTRHSSYGGLQPEPDVMTAKRGRDPFSSSESVTSTFSLTNSCAQKPQRRHSKRLSVSNSYHYDAPSWS